MGSQKSYILKLPWIISFAVSSLTMESNGIVTQRTQTWTPESLVLNAAWQSSLSSRISQLSCSFKVTVKVNRMFSKELVTILSAVLKDP